jgi:hypothetical protein
VGALVDRRGVHGGFVADGEFVVAGGHGPVALESADAAFDPRGAACTSPGSKASGRPPARPLFLRWRIWSALSAGWCRRCRAVIAGLDLHSAGRLGLQIPLTCSGQPNAMGLFWAVCGFLDQGVGMLHFPPLPPVAAGSGLAGWTGQGARSARVSDAPSGAPWTRLAGPSDDQAAEGREGPGACTLGVRRAGGPPGGSEGAGRRSQVRVVHEAGVVRVARGLPALPWRADLDAGPVT